MDKELRKMGLEQGEVPQLDPKEVLRLEREERLRQWNKWVEINAKPRQRILPIFKRRRTRFQKRGPMTVDDWLHFRRWIRRSFKKKSEHVCEAKFGKKSKKPKKIKPEVVRIIQEPHIELPPLPDKQRMEEMSKPLPRKINTKYVPPPKPQLTFVPIINEPDPEKSQRRYPRKIFGTISNPIFRVDRAALKYKITEELKKLSLPRPKVKHQPLPRKRMTREQWNMYKKYLNFLAFPKIVAPVNPYILKKMEEYILKNCCKECKCPECVHCNKQKQRKEGNYKEYELSPRLKEMSKPVLHGPKPRVHDTDFLRKGTGIDRLDNPPNKTPTGFEEKFKTEWSKKREIAKKNKQKSNTLSPRMQTLATSRYCTNAVLTCPKKISKFLLKGTNIREIKNQSKKKQRGCRDFKRNRNKKLNENNKENRKRGGGYDIRRKKSFRNYQKRIKRNSNKQGFRKRGTKSLLTLYKRHKHGGNGKSIIDFIINRIVQQNTDKESEERSSSKENSSYSGQSQKIKHKRNFDKINDFKNKNRNLPDGGKRKRKQHLYEKSSRRQKR